MNQRNNFSGFFNLVLVFILTLVIASCGRSKKETVSEMKLVDKTPLAVSKDSIVEDVSNYGEEFNLKNYLVESKIDEADLEEISESVALLIYPTHEQIEEMKKEYGEEDFYTVADDNSFYQGTAIGMIDSLGVKTITAKKRFVRFKGIDEKSIWTLDLRKSNAQSWNLIFFHKNKSPEIISTVDLDYEKIRDYFNL